MKTTNKIAAILLITFCISVMIFSCEKKDPDPGHFTVRMTDAPANYVKVNVDIIAMEVNHTSLGWSNIAINAGIYNLLELQNNVNVILANNVDLPPGTINQVRLILGSNNSLITLTDTFELKVPSGAETGLKINLNQTIQPNKTVEVLLDFDANTSVVAEGNGGYHLKPVIKVLSVNQF